MACSFLLFFFLFFVVFLLYGCGSRALPLCCAALRSHADYDIIILCLVPAIVYLLYKSWSYTLVCCAFVVISCLVLGIFVSWSRTKRYGYCITKRKKRKSVWLINGAAVFMYGAATRNRHDVRGHPVRGAGVLLRGACRRTRHGQPRAHPGKHPRQKR